MYTAIEKTKWKKMELLKNAKYTTYYTDRNDGTINMNSLIKLKKQWVNIKGIIKFQ